MFLFPGCYSPPEVGEGLTIEVDPASKVAHIISLNTIAPSALDGRKIDSTSGKWDWGWDALVGMDPRVN